MRLSLAFLFSLGIAFVACGAPKANFDDDDGSSGTSNGGAGGTTTVSNASAGGSTTTTTASSTVSNSSSTVVSSSAAVTVASSSSGPPSCLQDPDCPTCFCTQDPNGCNDYISLVMTHIYCGQSCSGDCSAFCNSMDPNQITPTCDVCVQNVSQTDIDAFIMACQASVDCSNFLNQIIMCP